MTPWLLAVTAGIYAWTAYSYLPDRPGMCGAFVCYALANLAFAYDAMKGAV